MKLRLQDVRLAFPALFDAKAFDEGQEATYQARFLIPKKNTKLIKEIEAALIEVATEKWGKKAPQILEDLKADKRTCLNDGDKKANWDGFEGCMFVSAKNATRPTIIDRNKAVLTKADGKPYAGCYVNANITIWAQDNKYGRRLNASLGGVQFVRDGDAFGGGRPASVDEFDDLGDGADADDII